VKPAGVYSVGEEEIQSTGHAPVISAHCAPSFSKWKIRKTKGWIPDTSVDTKDGKLLVRLDKRLRDKVTASDSSLARNRWE
jgi:hypothetical protein